MAEEIYLIDEVQELITEPEKLEEWKAQVEKLGLTGQATLLDGKKEKSPIPFPLMNSKMDTVYKTLCPRTSSVKDYAGSAIPLRVLSVIALANQEQYFESIEVWSDDKAPDPIVVGIRAVAGSTWQKAHYLMGRWGDELRSFPELVNLAKQRMLVEKTTEAKAKIADLKHKLDNISDLVEGCFENDHSLYI